MTFKTKPCLALIALLTAAGMHADILAWQPNSGSIVERTATVRESVTGLRSVTVKPVRVTSAVLDQSAAASGGSTYPGLEGIPSFPQTDLSPGDRWTADAAVTIDLSPFGHTPRSRRQLDRHRHGNLRPFVFRTYGSGARDRSRLVYTHRRHRNCGAYAASYRG